MRRCEAGAGVDAGSWSEADDDGESGASLDGGPYPEPRDGSAVTWDDWVSGFSSYYCAACHNAQASCSSGQCHVPTDPALYALVFDTQQKSAWAERASIIQCGIAATQAPGAACNVPPETFPKMAQGAPLPPDDERAILVNWLAAGCP